MTPRTAVISGAMPSRHPERPIVSKLDQFAEALSQDTLASPISVKAAGERVGISYDQANGYMQRLRKRLGKQAR